MEARGTLADGFLPDAQDFTKGKNGTLKVTVPYFQRLGEERTWAGAGGVLTSARDLVRFSRFCQICISWSFQAVWISMLLSKGRHPYTKETIIPEEVVEYVGYGRSVLYGKPQFPELVSTHARVTCPFKCP